MPEHIALSAGNARMTVAVRGAEMQSLRSGDGHEYLWQAGTAWPRHAPVLFPAICRHPKDLLRVDGQDYPLGHHGFARDLDFQVTDQGPDNVTLSLGDTSETRRQYPFEFRLEVAYHLNHAGVLVTFRVHNPGPRAIPFGIGFHPAFKWPLEAGAAGDQHVLIFDRPESGPTRRTQENLLLPQLFAEPSLGDGRMTLGAERFSEGAIILESLHSSSVQYRSASGRAVRLSWNGFRELALWSPAEGGLLCIEPWRGLPAPRDWTGEEADRPDLEHLAPGGTRTYSYRIDMEAPS